MIRVLAIDDEPLALHQLASYIKKVPFLQLVAECQSAVEAQQMMQQEMIDAIFCDINMPDLSGMDFVKQLAAPPLIVFTTAYSEYALEGYKVNAVDYLLKPFGMNDFLKAAMKVQEQYNLRHQHTSGESSPVQDDGTIFVKTDYRVVRIAIADIRYIEGMSEYLRIHLEGQKPIITLLAMKKMEEYLPKNQFMRIHRSYIVNLQKVVEVNKNRVILAKPGTTDDRTADTDTSLPIGDLYKEQFNDYLQRNFLGK